MFFIALGVVLLSMATYRSPAVALMPDLTPKPLRSQANAVINLMGAVGGMITLVLIRILIPAETNPNYTTLFIAVGTLMIITVTALVITIREKKLSNELGIKDEEDDEGLGDEDGDLPSDVNRSLRLLLASVFLWFMAYNAVTTAFSRYAVNVWGMVGGSFADALLVAMGAAIIAFIPIGFISGRIGRKKTIIIGIITMSLSYFCGFLFVDYHPAINVIFAFTGFGWQP